MTKLYGIAHGGTVGFIIGTDVEAYPSDDIISELQSLPKGSKIGLESLTEEEWIEVENNFKELGIKEGFEEENVGYKRADYWNHIIEAISDQHEIIFLEDKETWFRYNQIEIQFHKIRNEDREYNTAKEELEHNEETYNLHLLSKKVHQIDRDNKLLENIRANDVNVVLVGQGHSDYWMHTKEHGIDFTSYSTDIADLESAQMHMIYSSIPMDDFTVSSNFIKDAIPDPYLVLERFGLERALNLLENGRIVDGNIEPNFVGTWDPPNPSRGYFELFINERNGNGVKGIIEDCLGTANFNGELTPKKFNFIKHYDLNLCTKEAIPRPIGYKSEREVREFHGQYGDSGFMAGFIMKESPKEDPINLALSFYKNQ